MEDVENFEAKKNLSHWTSDIGNHLSRCHLGCEDISEGDLILAWLGMFRRGLLVYILKRENGYSNRNESHNFQLAFTLNLTSLCMEGNVVHTASLDWH